MGFHCRFRDAARGGIRLVRSRDTDVILPYSPKEAHTGAATKLCFTHYLNFFWDGILPGHSKIFTWHMKGKPEILYFGPDEGTAGMMDLGAKLACDRGYPYWNLLTTGKTSKCRTYQFLHRGVSYTIAPQSSTYTPTTLQTTASMLVVPQMQSSLNEEDASASTLQSSEEEFHATVFELVVKEGVFLYTTVQKEVEQRS